MDRRPPIGAMLLAVQRIERVAEAFRANFDSNGEVGASVCLTVGGETVVDLWGGTADPKTGAPVTSLIELEAGTRIVAFCAGSAAQPLLMATSGGYGFACQLGDMVTRLKGGKQFVAGVVNGSIVAFGLPATAATVRVRHPLVNCA